MKVFIAIGWKYSCCHSLQSVSPVLHIDPWKSNENSVVCTGNLQIITYVYTSYTWLMY